MLALSGPIFQLTQIFAVVRTETCTVIDHFTIMGLCNISQIEGKAIPSSTKRFRHVENAMRTDNDATGFYNGVQDVQTKPKGTSHKLDHLYMSPGEVEARWRDKDIAYKEMMEAERSRLELRAKSRAEERQRDLQRGKYDPWDVRATGGYALTATNDPSTGRPTHALRAGFVKPSATVLLVLATRLAAICGKQSSVPGVVCS